MSQAPPLTYLALDLETTGLDPERDIVLEVAVLALDAELAEAAHYTTIVRGTDPGIADRLMSPYVRDMHTKNGLRVEIAKGGGRTLTEIDDTLVQLAEQYPGRPVLCGSSVHFDRRFLRRYLPRIESALSHRHLDAATCSLLAPGLRGSADPEHRALADVRYSVGVLRTARTLLSLGASRRKS